MAKPKELDPLAIINNILAQNPALEKSIVTALQATLPPGIPNSDSIPKLLNQPFTSSSLPEHKKSNNTTQ